MNALTTFYKKYEKFINYMVLLYAFICAPMFVIFAALISVKFALITHLIAIGVCFTMVCMDFECNKTLLLEQENK